MDLIKWKCILNLDSVFKKIGQFSLLPFTCRKVGHVKLSSIFFLLLSLISHSRVRFENFLKIKYIKTGNITAKKNNTLKDF